MHPYGKIQDKIAGVEFYLLWPNRSVFISLYWACTPSYAACHPQGTPVTMCTQNYHWVQKPGSQSSGTDLRHSATHIWLSRGFPGTAAQEMWQLRPAHAFRVSETLNRLDVPISPYIALQVTKSSSVPFWISNCQSYKMTKCWITLLQLTRQGKKHGTCR